MNIKADAAAVLAAFVANVKAHPLLWGVGVGAFVLGVVVTAVI